ncbi:MAG: HEAT repeat domain-containing protein, partial [Gemmataceae bacterium]
RESRALIPDLIERINDSEELVRRAAQTSLKELTGKDFGPGSGSTSAEASKAYQAWLSWWKKQTRD